MYALTIRQPWAWAIMAGIKRVENRTWRTTHRGPLVIHAGKHRPRPRKRDWDRLPDGTPLPPVDDLAFGAVLGVVDLVDVVLADDPAVDGDPFVDPDPTGWCWILANPQPLPAPVPCSDSRMLWSIDYGEVLREARFLASEATDRRRKKRPRRACEHVTGNASGG